MNLIALVGHFYNFRQGKLKMVFTKMEPTNNYDFFDAEAYLREYFLQDSVSGDYNNFIFTKLHECFRSGNLKGKSMLEIGCGPVPLVSMYAQEYYDEIVLSDYAKSNREFLTAWKKGEKTEMLRPIFDKVAISRGNGSVAENTEKALRKKIRSILHCDIQQNNPISPVQLPLFDLVAAPYCMDEVVTDLKNMKEVFLNISNLLKPGGYFLYFGDDSSFYYLNGHRFRTNLQSISIDDRIKTFAAAGYKIVQWFAEHSRATDDIHQMYDSQTDLAMLVQKINNI